MKRSLRALSNFFIAAALCILPTAALAQGRVEPNSRALEAIESDAVYRPVGDWQLGESEVGCWVRREFAKGDQQIGFVLRRIQSGQPVQHVITGSGIGVRGRVEAGFDPGAGLNVIDRFHMSVFPEQDVIVFVHRPLYDGYAGGVTEAEVAAHARHYIVQGGRSDPIVIATGAVDGPLGMLADCTDRQLETYDVRPNQRGSYARFAVLTNPDEIGAHLRSGYGRVSRRHGYQGPVHLRLIVAPDGSLARCDVTTQFIAQPLRELACNTLAEHGQYAPALDARGNPTTDYFFQLIHFEIPPMPNADGTDPRRL